MKRHTLLTTIFALCFISHSMICSAAVKLPHIFTDNMVLQRDLAIRVWGWADPSEAVSVSFAGSSEKTVADQHGRWKVQLPAQSANSKPQSLTVAGTNTITRKNILIGDVWICSGQSNMEWPVRLALDPQKEIAAAKFPDIRLFDVPGHTTSPLPNADVPESRWRACSPETIANFSAVGYFFGRHIHQETNVPVGLIGTNWGGTRIEPWTPPAGFNSVPELKNIADQVNRFDPATKAGKATWNAYIESVGTWAKQADAALQAGLALPAMPNRPGYSAASQPCAIYNAMVHGLAPFGIRGAIWYQGESNGIEGISYYHKMQALIKGWRKVWNQGDDFPLYFYFVQLADFQKSNEKPAGGDGWARLREAQFKTLSVPHTGMAVITDIGNANDIHPRNKQDVGKRLALWALRDVARQDVVVSGPLYKDMKVEGNSIRIHFEHTGSGLMIGERKKQLEPTQPAENGKLQRFAIAGADKVWHWAEAKIDGQSVVVSSENVSKPVAVRYAYTMNPTGANLYNKEGLPASPFRTDSW